MHRLFSLFLCFILLTGCASPAQAATLDPGNMFSSRDLRTDWNASEAVQITLGGASASCADPSVRISGSTVTITDEGVYVVSGTLDDGCIIIDCGKKDKVHLILNGVVIRSQAFAAIHIRQADKVFITLADGSANTLENGGRFVPIDEYDVGAVIYSRDDLTVNGSGALRIISPAGHGVDTKDDLVIAGGVLDIEAGSHGLAANDSVRLRQTTLRIIAGKDGIQAENDEDASLGFVYASGGTFDITAGDDGVSASSDMRIDGGTFHIVSGGNGLRADGLLTITDGTIAVSGSYEGIEGHSVDISGGVISVVSSDDGLNASGSNGRGALLSISGGTITIDAEGDGVDANGSIDISGGIITVAGPTRPGNAAVDYDDSAIISGGTLIAYGTSGMAQNVSADLSQGAMLLSVGQQLPGTTVSVHDAAGKQLVSTVAAKPFSSILISCPELQQGETYTVRIDVDERTVTLDPLVWPASTRRH